MRHADAVDTAETDMMRGLSEQGILQAKSMGNKIREMDIGIDLVLCSKSLRTKQTLTELKLEAKNHLLRDPL